VHAKNKNKYNNLYHSWQNAGSGNVIFLDRQNVKCAAGSALSGFGLRRSGNQVRYQYYCNQHQGIKPTVTQRYTGWGPHNGSGGSTNYLDRHTVNCPSGQVLQGFRLNTSGSSIRYSYQCVAAEVGTCKERYTNWTDAGRSYENYYLDRQWLSVANNYNTQAIAGFKLNVSYRKWYQSGIADYRYWIKYCDLKVPKAKPVVLVQSNQNDDDERNHNTK